MELWLVYSTGAIHFDREASIMSREYLCIMANCLVMNVTPVMFVGAIMQNGSYFPDIT